MSLWSEIVQTFIPWTRKRGGKGKSSAGGGAPDLKELKQPLTVPATRQGRSKPLTFQLTEMALNAFVFNCTSAVIKGEMMTMELDLPGHGRTKLTGTVEWALDSGSGTTGQINIWTSPEQRVALNQLIRQLRRY